MTLIEFGRPLHRIINIFPRIRMNTVYISAIFNGISVDRMYAITMRKTYAISLSNLLFIYGTFPICGHHIFVNDGITNEKRM